jgi:hypothetical protein
LAQWILTEVAGKSKILVLTDFQTQVEQFLAYERGRRVVGHDAYNGWTVFDIFFGLWAIPE